MNDTGELQGFCIDLLDELQKMMNFTYDIYIVEDGFFGSEQPNGTWNGIVGDIIEGVSYGNMHSCLIIIMFCLFYFCFYY